MVLIVWLFWCRDVHYNNVIVRVPGLPIYVNALCVWDRQNVYTYVDEIALFN
jgi:hypothetical protein